MLNERVEARLLDGDLRFAARVVVRALLDFLVQHLEEVLLTRRNVPATRVGGDAMKKLHRRLGKLTGSAGVVHFS